VAVVDISNSMHVRSQRSIGSAALRCTVQFVVVYREVNVKQVSSNINDRAQLMCCTCSCKKQECTVLLYAPQQWRKGEGALGQEVC
jgi:hypothetical protein